MLTLSIMAKESIESFDYPFTLKIHSESSIADNEGKVIEGVILEVPSLRLANTLTYLADNYPNPVSGETTIQFNLAEEGYATLDVYNTAGELIERLVNQYLEAGIYSAVFDVNSIKPGVYFYRLKVDGAIETFSDVKKMLIVKTGKQ